MKRFYHRVPKRTKRHGMVRAISVRSHMARVGAFALCFWLSACTTEVPPTNEPVASPSPTYVGSEKCTNCHEEQFSAWQKSQHFLAMQPAKKEAVVGDFNDAQFEYAGIDYHFFTRDNKFFVRADSSDGEMQDFEISHTFGVEPLQQYLISFPDGRRQALSVAWDARPEETGGQRWFHLYPDDAITHGDELHWTGRNQNWNYMCADCHSTDLKKNYDLASKTYDTHWAEISVGCEACHGPGSAHIDAAQSGNYNDSSLPSMLATQKAEIETCAHCHSRRGVIAENFQPGREYFDHYRLALLDEGLYHADGQILDEVYVYGSFLQSKMYQHGVRCTDCHNPHNAELRASGNATCTRCHQNVPPSEFPTLKTAVYDSPEHHFHAPDSVGAQCVNCHMASKNYMVVDPRRDHSFRIPRPDLSESIGSPNACNGCHENKTAAWATAEISKRFSREATRHYGEAISAGRSGAEGAAQKLATLANDTAAPAIVRGTALSLLDGYADDATVDALTSALHDDAALVRFGALNGVRSIDLSRRWELAKHLLDDPLLAIRIEAAIILAQMLDGEILQVDSERLLSAIREYMTAQMLNADRPEALTNIGGLSIAVRDQANAETAYRRALDLDPDWVPALVNLADLYRNQGREDESASLLGHASSVAQDNAAVRYAHGLSLVRQGRTQEAFAELRQATLLNPEDPRYLYAYGIALNSFGETELAVAALESGYAKFPNDTDILFALVTIERDRGSATNALRYLNALLQLRPNDPNLLALREQLDTLKAK